MLAGENVDLSVLLWASGEMSGTLLVPRGVR
jgi:hypothetical protein